MVWLMVLPGWLTDEKQGMTLATWCLVFTGITAIIFAACQLSADRRQRRVENMAKIIDDFNGGRMRTHRHRFAEARLKENTLARKDEVEFPECGLEVLDFCEHVAFLARNGHLDLVQTWSVLGNWIGAYNQDLAAHIKNRISQEKTTYEDFLWLVGKLCKIDKKKGGAFFTAYSDRDLERLYIHDRRLLQIGR